MDTGLCVTRPISPPTAELPLTSPVENDRSISPPMLNQPTSPPTFVAATPTPVTEPLAVAFVIDPLLDPTRPPMLGRCAATEPVA